MSRGVIAEISGRTVWRWLSEDAIKPWRRRSWIFPRDPDFEPKAGRVLDLLCTGVGGQGPRKSLFLELDRPALKPLPASRYEFATCRSAKLGPDYHVEVRADRHYYSAPHSLIGEVLDVRLSATTVEVFFRHRRVASHPRSYRPGYTTDPAHMPGSHRRYASWTPARVVSWARKTGPATAKLAEAVLASRPHPEQGFRTCLGIMRLGKRYGPERLEAAAERALALRSYTYRSVEPVLRHGLDKRPLPAEKPPAPALPAHANVRGPGYYR